MGSGGVQRADAALAGFVGACDGELTGAQIAAALAHLLEEPAGELAARLAPAVRGLVADGLLLPDSVGRRGGRRPGAQGVLDHGDE